MVHRIAGSPPGRRLGESPRVWGFARICKTGLPTSLTPPLPAAWCNARGNGHGTPGLVDYGAGWCGPCKMIAPILDEVSKTYDGKLRVAKMNVDENRDVPAKYGIRGIPTLILFKGGQVAAQKVGALSKSQLTAFIDSHLDPVKGGQAAAQ